MSRGMSDTRRSVRVSISTSGILLCSILYAPLQVYNRPQHMWTDQRIVRYTRLEIQQYLNTCDISSLLS